MWGQEGSKARKKGRSAAPGLPPLSNYTSTTPVRPGLTRPRVLPSRRHPSKVSPCSSQSADSGAHQRQLRDSGRCERPHQAPAAPGACPTWLSGLARGSLVPLTPQSALFSVFPKPPAPKPPPPPHLFRSQHTHIPLLPQSSSRGQRKPDICLRAKVGELTCHLVNRRYSFLTPRQTGHLGN